MTSIPAPRATLSSTAFATLLLIALMMGANHVAARVTFDHGVDVITAVTFRSAITAIAVGGLLALQRVMAFVAAIAFAASSVQDGLHLPNVPAGWVGLGLLTFLYGTAFLGQSTGAVQALGGLIVVATVIGLALRRS